MEADSERSGAGFLFEFGADQPDDQHLLKFWAVVQEPPDGAAAAHGGAIILQAAIIVPAKCLQTC